MATNRRRSTDDNVRFITQAVVKVAAIIALVLILLIDANNHNFEAKEIQLILAGFIAGSEALERIKKKVNK